MLLSRIGLEAGPLSQWLYVSLAGAGFAVELLETRHVRDAFKSMPIKIDVKDASGIAQLMVDGVAGNRPEPTGRWGLPCLLWANRRRREKCEPC